ncbi:MAG TPA: tRNA lysidine(34) synthetase TilS, partial [Acidimicrobiia bacterium]|nr:tRNA lysidine(34) synthetase TilS [Acidimicrobiia bacterium]
MTLEPFRHQLIALDGLPPNARVVVACSGGADSLALLALAVDRGFVATAVYVDHGLRPNTEHEHTVVARAAAQLGAQSAVVSVDLEGGANLEARARDARYDALVRVAAEQQAAAVFVGHTRDDQAETILLNLLRGSGVAGLAGMPAVRGIVRRPLLQLRRAATREICARLGFAPVQDPMNDDAHFRRVWLRREVIPMLERGADRDIVEVIARQADAMRDDNDLLESLVPDVAIVDDVAALGALPP